ncbi:DUF3445 domain-containing protein [Candidatus Pacearchaeota archaeon]|nr:DUF3445 domain-containing protein [Candidatus Pacearchaeota archaeon]
MIPPEDLPPANYLPALIPNYSVKLGFHNLGTDFGNGNLDCRIFQIDSNYRSYIKEKLKCREQHLSAYSREFSFKSKTKKSLIEQIVNTISKEYPSIFEIKQIRGRLRFRNNINKETIYFDENMNFESPNSTIHPKYASPLDALACQFQEDLAVMQLEESSNYLSVGHICFPSSWALEEKIGKDFSSIHMPVQGMNLKTGQYIAEVISRKGPFVRFVFGLSNDEKLNHHSSKNPPDSFVEFNPENPKLFLRIERQTTSPIHDANASLFTIRLYVHDCATFSKENKETLASFIDSMTEDQLMYKGLLKNRDSIIEWFRS